MATTNSITTKYGSFMVEDDGKGGSIISIEGVARFAFSKVAWWDRDALEKAIERNHEGIQKCVAAKVRGLNISRANAEDALEQLIKAFGNEEKSFYSSRLKQCLNRLRQGKDNGEESQQEN